MTINQLIDAINNGARPPTMTTYTIMTGEGDMISTGNSLNDAAAAVLTSDGREFDIRADGGGYTLWSRHEVANEPWSATSFWSGEGSREDATQEIFTAVVNCERMLGHDEAITDELYAQMIDAEDSDQ